MGLVQEDDLGFEGDGAGERDALLLAAGQSRCGALRELCEPDESQRLLDGRPSLRARNATPKGKATLSKTDMCGQIA